MPISRKRAVPQMLAAILAAIAAPLAANGEVVVWPAAPGTAERGGYSLFVNGIPVDVMAVPKSTIYAEDKSFPYSYAMFDADEEVLVEIRSPLDLSRARVLPRRHAVLDMRAAKDSLSFRAKPPFTLAIEPLRTRHRALILSAGLPEKNAPRAGDAGVVFYGPGRHRLDKPLELRGGQTLYLAPGAWLEGAVRAKGDNITICGRGVISGLPWAHRKGPAHDMVNLSGKNVAIRDVTLMGSWFYTLALENVKGGLVENVKVIGGRCNNDDGIDPIKARDVTIRDCFVRTHDDCIAPKDWIDNLLVERCSLWADGANPIRLGFECIGGPSMPFRHIRFRNIDILHQSMKNDVPPDAHWIEAAIHLQPSNGMVFEDIVFEDFCFDACPQAMDMLLAIRTHPCRNGPQFPHKEGGHVRNVTFRNFNLPPRRPLGSLGILLRSVDAGHAIEDVSFENMRNFEVPVGIFGEVRNIRGLPRGVVRGEPHLDPPPVAEDSFAYAWDHPRLVVVRLQDDTDRHDDLWFETEYLLSRCEAPFDVSAPAMFIEDSIGGDGMAFFRLAPLPHARTDKTPDFRVDPGGRSVGINSTAYPCVRVPYSGGPAGRVRAATDFQRARRPYVPGRDGVFLSNTWGDGNRDACINDAFLRREIAAGAELGVDVIQIDDGWQRGRTANSSAIKNRREGRWGAYWDDPHFWDVDRVRFPDGLEGLVAEAKAKGMKFGLWFGPDSSNDAKNWSRDADFLLGLHRSLGIDYFKLDSMRSETAVALERQAALFRRLMAESDSRITVDLDVTAGIRPGYYGFPEIGPVFVENRYIRPKGRDSRLWWPHRTLHNLWGLAHVVDPVRLRMEVLNPCRLPDAYPDGDPLAPMRWPREAIFAIAMFASPLGWFEIQNLDAETVAAWRPLVARWKRERDAIHSGYVYPVGDPPDGMSWTGFLAVSKDGTGHALLFRELSPDATFSMDISPYRVQEDARAEIVGGRGCATVADGRLSVSVPDKLGFAWVKISPASALVSSETRPAMKGKAK